MHGCQPNICTYLSYRHPSQFGFPQHTPVMLAFLPFLKLSHQVLPMGLLYLAVFCLQCSSPRYPDDLSSLLLGLCSHVSSVRASLLSAYTVLHHCVFLPSSYPFIDLIYFSDMLSIYFLLISSWNVRGDLCGGSNVLFTAIFSM